MKDSQRKAIFANVKSKEHYVDILKKKGEYRTGALGNTPASFINNISIKKLMTEDRQRKLSALATINDKKLSNLGERIYMLKAKGKKPTSLMMEKYKEYQKTSTEHHNIGMELIGQKLGKAIHPDASGKLISLYESAEIPNR